MSTDFQINALDKEHFSKYFQMTSAELNDRGAYVFSSDECPCYPCRVSLTDAKVGEAVLAVSFEHHPVASPYRSAGPIFVRTDSNTAMPEVNEIPDMLRLRLLSVRGYNTANLMIEADTVNGKDLESIISQQFSNPLVEYIHLHNAGAGCFNCTITRV